MGMTPEVTAMATSTTRART
uniref:Uncharacterized protein n=1 Tax=Rhizophora mucronata TaxID=61149 RepID=A0A2P2P095_RHIMU